MFLFLTSCSVSKSTSNDGLPDSLFSYRELINTNRFEDTLKHGKKVTRHHYIKWIKPYEEQKYNIQIDTNKLMMDEYYFISKLSLNSSYNSFIIEAEGDDMDGLLLFNIDSKGDYVDCYHLAGIIGCTGAWEADSGYYETCKLRNSLIKNSSILTNIKNHYFKPVNDSVNLVRIDSINFKTEVNEKGKFISSKLDSIRVYRYERNK